jgi:hypothetical protein
MTPMGRRIVLPPYWIVICCRPDLIDTGQANSFAFAKAYSVHPRARPPRAAGRTSTVVGQVDPDTLG